MSGRGRGQVSGNGLVASLNTNTPLIQDTSFLHLRTTQGKNTLKTRRLSSMLASDCVEALVLIRLPSMNALIDQRWDLGSFPFLNNDTQKYEAFKSW